MLSLVHMGRSIMRELFMFDLNYKFAKIYIEDYNANKHQNIKQMQCNVRNLKELLNNNLFQNEVAECVDQNVKKIHERLKEAGVHKGHIRRAAARALSLLGFEIVGPETVRLLIDIITSGEYAEEIDEVEHALISFGSESVTKNDVDLLSSYIKPPPTFLGSYTRPPNYPTEPAAKVLASYGLEIIGEENVLSMIENDNWEALSLLGAASVGKDGFRFLVSKRLESFIAPHNSKPTPKFDRELASQPWFSAAMNECHPMAMNDPVRCLWVSLLARLRGQKVLIVQWPPKPPYWPRPSVPDVLNEWKSGHKITDQEIYHAEQIWQKRPKDYMWPAEAT